MKKILKKYSISQILLIVISVILFVTICHFAIRVHNASQYLESKYDKDFKVSSLKLPYYDNNADIFDFPLIYIPGDRIPLTIYFNDGNKSCTVIYDNGDFYDDYQLEDISRYITECFIDITKNENIVASLCIDSPDLFAFEEYYVLNDILKTDNRLWTKDNIFELIEKIVYYNDGSFSVYVYDDYSDTDMLLNKAEKIEYSIYDSFPTISQKYFINVCFTNHDLDIRRIYSKDFGSIRFDGYGFETEQPCIGITEVKASSPDVLNKSIVEQKYSDLDIGD